MKVVHLSTSDAIGGAAKAAFRQHQALRKLNLDSQMLVRYRYSSDSNVTVFPGKRDIYNRSRRFLRRTYLAKLSNWKHHNSSLIKQKGRLRDPRADLLQSAESLRESDIINIHKIEDFVDVPSFFKSLDPNKPVVITLHDMNWITGGCDYAGECIKFTDRCGDCPIINYNISMDYSSFIFQLKQKSFQNISDKNLVFVANSEWTKKQAERSFLSHKYRIKTIHLAVDDNIYHPDNRDEARKALNLPLDIQIILFSAHNINSPRKGVKFLLEAIKLLAENNKLFLLSFGAGSLELPKNIPYRNFGRVDNESLQSIVYRAADVFVIPSTEEAFGQTALEAAACGTLVAGFDVGGIRDIITNGMNGFLVSCYDYKSLAAAIEELLKNTSMRNKWQQSCQKWVLENFSYEVIGRNYLSLYNSLLSTSN